MPNCFGPPPIFMPDDFNSKSGFTRTATLAARPERSRYALQQTDLARRFKVDQNAGGNRLLQFAFGLAGAGETDVARIHSRVERDAQFSAGRDIQAIDQPRHVVDERGHRVGLDRVVQGNFVRQVLAQQIEHVPRERRDRRHRTASDPPARPAWLSGSPPTCSSSSTTGNSPLKVGPGTLMTRSR